MTLHKWNGTNGAHKLDNLNIADNLFQDNAGTVYYLKNGDPVVWCLASELSAHIRHLNQILARA